MQETFSSFEFTKEAIVFSSNGAKEKNKKYRVAMDAFSAHLSNMLKIENGTVDLKFALHEFSNAPPTLVVELKSRVVVPPETNPTVYCKCAMLPSVPDGEEST